MFAMVGALVLVLALGLGGCMTVLPTIDKISASPMSGNAPLTVIFSAEMTCADSWFWDFGGTGTSTEENPVHVFQNPGIYAVTLTATNNGFCGPQSVTKGVTITVGEKPFVRIMSINIDLNPVCTNIPTRVSAVVEHNYPITYEWSSSDGHADSAASTTFTFGAAGTKTIYLTVRDNTGTVANKTATLTVKDCCDPCPDDPCDDPCDPCESVVLDRLEPERACVDAYREFEITALFKGWPCLDPCSVLETQAQEIGIQGIVPCPQEPDCGGCSGKKISWSFAHNCCGGDAPVLGEDFEIVGVPWGEFGQYIRVKFFVAGTWKVIASLNGEEVTGRYEVVVQ